MTYGGGFTIAPDDEEAEYDNAETVENEAPYTGPRQRTSPPFPSAPPTGFESWREFFADAKAKARAKNEAPSSEPARPTGHEKRDPLDKSVPLGIRKIAVRLAAAGWLFDCLRYTMHVPDQLYAGASADGEKSAGDLKKAAHDIAGWFLIGAAPHLRGQAGFRAHWTESVSTKTGKAGATFDWVQITDPVGMPTELYYEYKPAKASKVDKYETAASVEIRQQRMTSLAAQANFEFNDGAEYLERHPLYTATKPFEEWLDEALDVFAAPPVKEAAA